MKRIVIVGATSGIGLEVAKLCIREGWRVGAAGRREEALEALRATAPNRLRPNRWTSRATTHPDSSPA